MILCPLCGWFPDWRVSLFLRCPCGKSLFATRPDGGVGAHFGCGRRNAYVQSNFDGSVSFRTPKGTGFTEAGWVARLAFEEVLDQVVEGVVRDVLGS